MTDTTTVTHAVLHVTVRLDGARPAVLARAVVAALKEHGVAFPQSQWEPDRDTIADAYGVDFDALTVIDLNDING